MAVLNYANAGLPPNPNVAVLFSQAATTTQFGTTAFERTIAGGEWAGSRVLFGGTGLIRAAGVPSSGAISAILLLKPDGGVIATTSDFASLNRNLADWNTPAILFDVVFVEVTGGSASEGGDLFLLGPGAARLGELRQARGTQAGSGKRTGMKRRSKLTRVQDVEFQRPPCRRFPPSKIRTWP